MHVSTLSLRVTVLSCILLASSPARADVWVAVNSTGAGALPRVAKLASDGRILFTVDSVFGRPFRYCIGVNIIAVDPRNGHAWVSDVNNNRVFELNADGEPLREVTLFAPVGIEIDANNGAVWTSILTQGFEGAIVKLDPDTGQARVTVTGFSGGVLALAVGPSGQVWVADRFNNEVVVLFGTDEELDGYDASTPAGAHHLRSGGFDEPFDIDVDPRNGSNGVAAAWVADRTHGEAVKIGSNGTELVRTHPTSFVESHFVSVDSRDGSVWVADEFSSRLAKLSALGEETLNQHVAFLTALKVDAAEDAVWLGTGFLEQARLRKLDRNGAELLSVSGLSTVCGIGVTSLATVVIDGCDSGVPNAILPSGHTISDHIAACRQAASNHGQFVRCVAYTTNELVKAGIIDGQQKGAIQQCAARARVR